MSDSDAAKVAGSEGRLRPPFSHDWEADPRPLAECLKEWQVRINGGREYGAREAARAALRIKSAATYAGILRGRPSTYEPTIRLTMTLIDRLDPAP